MNTLDSFKNSTLTNHSKSTIKTYMYELQQFEKWLNGVGTDFFNYSRSDVQQYMNYLISKKKSSSTINKIFYAIKNFYVWIKNSEAINDIYKIQQLRCNISENSESNETLNGKDLKNLFFKISKDNNKRNSAIIITMLYTGIKISECVDLNKSNVSLTSNKPFMTIKNGSKERVVPLHSKVVEQLNSYLKTRTDNEEALFTSNRNKRISIRMVQTIFERYGIKSYQCRNTFIATLLKEGKDFGLIQSLTGYECRNTLYRYGKKV